MIKTIYKSIVQHWSFDHIVGFIAMVIAIYLARNELPTLLNNIFNSTLFVDPIAAALGVAIVAIINKISK